jgi:hypothetical protein
MLSEPDAAGKTPKGWGIEAGEPPYRLPVQSGLFVDVAQVIRATLSHAAKMCGTNRWK